MASELDGVRPWSVLRNNTSVNSGAEEQIADQGKKKKKKRCTHLKIKMTTITTTQYFVEKRGIESKYSSTKHFIWAV